MPTPSKTQEAKTDKIKAYEASKKTPILNKKGTAYEKTKDNFVPHPDEENSVHAIIEQKSFNPSTGKRQSVPKIQVFNTKAFENFKKASVALGYTVTVLHHPSGDYEPFGLLKLELEAEKE